MPPKANLRSTSTKRILQEHKEFILDPSEEFVAHPLEEDLFEWHVTVRGSEGSDYEGGLYHLRVLLPPTYPLAAPDLLALTPSGRFETNRKICIDGITSFHEGSWRPIWGVRTAVVGMMSFWNQGGAEAVAGLGGLNYEGEMKRKLAKESVNYTCPQCQKSNAQIMADHQITLRDAKAAQEAKKASGSGSGSGSVKQVEGGQGQVEAEMEKKVAPVTEMATMETNAVPAPSSVPTTRPAFTSKPSSSTSSRPHVEIIETPLPATTPHPTPLESLLTSPLTQHAILPAPLKLLFHLLQLLLIPTPLLTAHNLPTKLNTLLFLDTCIWFISVIGIWLIGGKVLRVVGLVRKGKRVGRVGKLLAEGGTAVGAGVMEALPRRNGGPAGGGGAGRTPNVRAGLADGAGAPRAVHTGQPEIVAQPEGAAGAGAGHAYEERVIDERAGHGHGHGHGHGNEANIRQRTGMEDVDRMRGAAVGAREDL